MVMGYDLRGCLLRKGIVLCPPAGLRHAWTGQSPVTTRTGITI